MVALLAFPSFSIAQTELKINADIRGRNCNGGLGLCSVSSTSETKADNQEFKTTAYKLDESTLVLEFNKTMLSEDEQKSLLNTTISKIDSSHIPEFIQEEEVIVDSEMLLLLGIAPKYNTIKKGNYPLLITDNAIKVTLKLWEQ